MKGSVQNFFFRLFFYLFMACKLRTQVIKLDK